MASESESSTATLLSLSTLRDSGITLDSLRQALYENTSYITPRGLPLKLRLCLIALASVWVAIGCHRQNTWRTALLSVIVAGTYVFGVVVAKMLVDRAIPLDGRILSPAYLALVFGAVGACRPPQRISTIAVGMLIAGCLASQYVDTMAAATWGVRNEGSGWFKASWMQADALQALRSCDPGIPVYSNAADGVAIVLRDRRVRWSPANHDDQMESFAAKLSGEGGIFAYFPNDFRKGRLLTDKQTERILSICECVRFNQAVVYVANQGANGTDALRER